MKYYDVVCLNGEYLPASEAQVSILDQGILYGAGLFETIKVLRGAPIRTDLHLTRLASSAKDLGLQLLTDDSSIHQMLMGMVSKNNMREGALRLTLTLGGMQSKPIIFIIARKLPYIPSDYDNGIKIGCSRIRRNKASLLVKHKTINYFENIIAKREALEHGWDEAVMLNSEGAVAEGSMSNIFFVSGDRVITPDVGSGLLPGIMRGLVINHCKDFCIPIEERTVMPGEINNCREIFITNALIGVLPVTRFESRLIADGKPGEITGLMMKLLSDL